MEMKNQYSVRYYYSALAAEAVPGEEHLKWRKCPACAIFICNQI